MRPAMTMMGTVPGRAFVMGASGAVYSYLLALVTMLPELIQFAWLPSYQKSSIENQAEET